MGQESLELLTLTGKGKWDWTDGRLADCEISEGMESVDLRNDACNRIGSMGQDSLALLTDNGKWDCANGRLAG